MSVPGNSKQVNLAFGLFDKEWGFTDAFLCEMTSVSTTYICVHRKRTKPAYKLPPLLINFLLHLQLMIVAVRSARGRQVKNIYVGFGGWSSIIFAYLLCRLFGAQLIFSPITVPSIVYDLYKPKSKFYISRQRLIERLAFYLSDVLIFESENLVEFLLKRGVSVCKEKVVIFPLFLNRSKFIAPMTATPNCRCIWYGHASNLHGLDKLLSAFVTAGKKNKAISLTILSTNTICKVLGVDSFASLSEKFSGSNIEFLEWRPGFSHSFEEVNRLICGHSYGIGSVITNEHLDTVLLNKELEIQALGLRLITRKRESLEDEIFNDVFSFDSSSSLVKILEGIGDYEATNPELREVYIRERKIAFRRKVRFVINSDA